MANGQWLVAESYLIVAGRRQANDLICKLAPTDYGCKALNTARKTVRTTSGTYRCYHDV